VSDWLGLSGRRVLVAGAGSLGAAVASGFRDAGATVVAVDADAARLASLAELADIDGFTADLATADACRAAIGEASRRLGGIDVLVHSAGINKRVLVEEFTDAEWESIISVNLSSAFHTARAALPAMRAQGFGRVIFFSSVAGLLGHRNHGPYAASKGAINQLTKVMAHEYAPAGVTVNAVAPGYMETDLTGEYLDSQPPVRDHLLSLIPAQRFGQLSEVVGPVLFLASHHASFISGHILYIDGARTVV
jgi:gluconate 5-dehydrogenase